MTVLLKSMSTAPWGILLVPWSLTLMISPLAGMPSRKDSSSPARTLMTEAAVHLIIEHARQRHEAGGQPQAQQRAVDPVASQLPFPVLQQYHHLFAGPLFDGIVPDGSVFPVPDSPFIINVRDIHDISGFLWMIAFVFPMSHLHILLSSSSTAAPWGQPCAKCVCPQKKTLRESFFVYSMWNFICFHSPGAGKISHFFR